MNTLTKIQRETLDYIASYIEKNGYAPSFDDIRDNFGLSAISTVHDRVSALVDKGFLKRYDRRERGLSLPKKRMDYIEIPIKGTISCGLPIEALEEDDDTTIKVARDYALRGKLFALRAKGDSMIEDGILDGDIIIAKQQNVADNGDTVVALLEDNEATLKRIYQEQNRIRLQPANGKYEPTYHRHVDVQGVVVKVIRNIV